ncbi:MAG: hypothetical protein HGA45_18150 [Chloroflexales bacterium]|nr:hypothetical protein [Chloroflexales bacterium]
MTSFADAWSRPRVGAAELAQWYYLGRGALAHKDWAAAQSAFTSAAAQLRDRAEWSLLWLCYLALATLAWRAEEAETALEHAREAHVLADRLEGPWPHIWSMWLLGQLYAGHHQRAEAGVCFSAVYELLDEQNEDRQAMRHLAAVAAMMCAAAGPGSEPFAEQLFGLAQLSLRVGKRQGLPLEAIEGLERAPRLARAAALGDTGAGWGPIEWLRSILPQSAPPARPAAPPESPHSDPPPPPEPAAPTADSAPDLRAYCLGRFEVWVGHTLVTQWAGSKSKTLLKLLLTAYPAMVPAASLMSALWDGVDEELARQRLHTAISDLRRALKAAWPEVGGLIVSQNGSYGFDPRATIWIDTIEFGRAQRAGLHYAQLGRYAEAQATFREAVALYRGELLAEDLYEDWPIEQRERLKSEYLTLLTRLGQWACDAGDYEACLSWGRLTLECDPCREDTHRLLMRSYSRLGQRAMALRQYRQCVDALRRELDALPEPESEELYRRLQKGQEI